MPENKGLSRREFLHTTAAAGASLAITPVVFGQSAGAKVDDINVAILGAGAQGQVLLDAMLKIPNSGIRFKAVCDIWTEYNQKRMVRTLKRQKHEVNAYEDYRKMLDKEDLDAVIVATPDFWHSPHAVACLEKGLHVYCEKEMSNTLEGARKMVEAARKSGKQLQIGHQRRSNPRYKYCYEKVIKETGMIGQITTVNGQWNRSRQACVDLETNPRYNIDEAKLKLFEFESMKQFRNWRWYKGKGGGPIVDLGSHQIDIYSWFLDAHPRSVMASGGVDYWTDHEWYDNVIAIYEFETKAGIVRAEYRTGTTNSNGGYFEHFMGDHGTLEISEAKGRGSVYREGWVDPKEWDKYVTAGIVLAPPEEKKTESESEPEKTDTVLDVRESPTPPKYDLQVTMDKAYHQPHLENFFNAVRGKEKLNCPGEIGYETAVMVLKVNDAVAAKKQLDFKPEDFKV